MIPDTTRWNPAMAGAYYKGMQAALDGKPVEACPYEDKRKASGRLSWSRAFIRAWSDGWFDATREREQALAALAARRGRTKPKKVAMVVSTGRPTFEVADVRYEPMTPLDLSPQEAFSPSADGFWRTLVRVIDVSEFLFRCEVPGWSSRTFVVLTRAIVPEPLQSALEPNLRFHAYATIGAQDPADLRFRGPWEWDGRTAAEQKARIDEYQAMLDEGPPGRR